MSTIEFFESYFNELTIEMQSNTTLKKFSNNTDVIGAYAENTVRLFISKFFNNNQLSTGTLTHPRIFSNPKDTKQLDVMIWKPNPLPPLFEKGNFAIIPSSSCFGVIEVKRSDYGEKIAESVNGILNYFHRYGFELPFLCVICLNDYKSHQELDKLIEQNIVVHFLEKSKTGNYIPDIIGISKLINFLLEIRESMQNKHYRIPSKFFEYVIKNQQKKD